MNPEQLKKAVRLVKAVTQNKMLVYKPYDKQREFHNNGAQFRERLLLAGNQCLTYETEIDLPGGVRRTVGSLFDSGEEFDVFAYENGDQVVRLALPVFKKTDQAECYRVTMSDGRSFECSGQHQLLTASGYTNFEVLLKSWPELLACSDESGSRSARAADDRHSSETLRDFQDRCCWDSHRDDGRPPSSSVADLVSTPSRDDAQQRGLHAWCSSDGQEPKSTRSLLGRLSDRLSSWGEVLRLSAQSFEFATQAAYSDVEPCLLNSPVSGPLLYGSIFRLRSSPSTRASRSSQANLSPVSVGGNKIVSVKPIGVHSIYDFEVPGPNNYVLAGLVHHNSGKTFAAAMEVAYHATGRYPEWWEGRRFNSPIRAWVAGTSAEGTRDTVQRLLLGDGPDYGTGTIPKTALNEVKQARTVTGAVGQMYVNHVAGGVSYIGVRTYEQPRERWQGESLNLLWCDEEPPLGHYTEGLTRLNAREGIALMTMTPLLGMTETVKMFYPHPTTLDRSLTMMTIEDVDHYTENEKQQIIASYPEYEREARLRGIPMLGSGRVFPVTIESISCKPFEIPEHWPVLGGIDFGWDHPTGAVSIAWDRDADCIYVTHAYRERERTPSQIAVELKDWNRGMPWTWPHDGYVHDKGSGVTISDQYRREGLRMMREHATFDKGGHGFEAGVMEMLDRMKSGRLKVFHHLEDWFGEFNIYHRKDGRIVKESDDLLSATRLCVMAKRFARTKDPIHKFPATAGQNYDPFARKVA